MNYGGSVSGHCLLFNDIDELEGAADWGVWVGPLGTLEVTHLQNIVVLGETPRMICEVSVWCSDTTFNDVNTL